MLSMVQMLMIVLPVRYITTFLRTKGREKLLTGHLREL